MSSRIATSKLFQPINVGATKLQHRVVLAPLTRMRASDDHVHGDLALEYYTQRASTPGTLLISEGTIISPEAAGWLNAPGIWNDAQIAAWKRITDAVHAKGCTMVIQLFGMGRAANPVALEKDGLGVIAAGPSAIKLAEYNDFPLRVLTEEEIVDYVHKFEQAARNAMAAGFDGVEIHGANGYLIDQFIQDTANERTDRYGGSIENRSRFALEIVDAVVAAIGAERTAIRFSPWSRYQEMRMTDPIPTFTYLIEQIKERHPSLMYLHMIEPNVFGGFSSEDSSTEYRASQGDSNDFAYKLWAPRPYITAGGYGNNLEAAVAAAEKGDASLVAFGKAFIANPDLPYRLRNSIPLHKYDRSSFYLIEDPKGYTDQPFASERTTKG